MSHGVPASRAPRVGQPPADPSSCFDRHQPTRTEELSDLQLPARGSGLCIAAKSSSQGWEKSVGCIWSLSPPSQGTPCAAQTFGDATCGSREAQLKTTLPKSPSQPHTAVSGTEHMAPCFAGTQSSPMSRNEGTQPPSGALTASGLSPSTRNHSQRWSQLRSQPPTPVGLQRSPYSKVLHTAWDSRSHPWGAPSAPHMGPSHNSLPEPQTPALSPNPSPASPAHTAPAAPAAQVGLGLAPLKYPMGLTSS